MKRNLLLVALCLPPVLVCTAPGNIIYVDDDAQAGGDGRSWATAYRYLQDALADARAADTPVEIRIAQGTYRPDQVTDQTWWRMWFELTSGVALKGGYAGVGASVQVDPNVRDIALYETILSGDLAGNDVEVDDPCDLEKEPTRADNTGLLTTVYQAEDVLLDGITIANGRVISPVETRGGTGGGAIVIRNSSPTINSCTFRGNTAEIYGGAVFIDAGHPMFTNCTFMKNYAFGGGAIQGGDAGTQIANCSFINNAASSSGGAVAQSLGTISHCVFRGNSANRGGALARCRGLIAHCLFAGNSASQGGGAVEAVYRDTPTFKNCVFADNRATGTGGGLFTSGGATVTLVNCTFSGNSGIDGNALACYSWHAQHPPSRALLTSCILWDGGREIWSNDDSTIIVTYSDVFGGYSGVGNIDLDPLLADRNNGDFRLKSQGGRWDPNSQSWVQDDVTSPCVDAGDPNSPVGYEPFPTGGIVNMGAYGGTPEASKSYFGEPVCETVIAGDLNGDCRVDFADLAILLKHWLDRGEQGHE